MSKQPWKHTQLRDILDICRNGLVCSQDADPVHAMPVTRIETISKGIIDFDRVGFAPLEEVNPDYLIQKGDILLSHINSVKHIGKVAIKQDDQPLLHGMNLMLLRFNKQVDPEYAYAVMDSLQTKKYFERRAKKAVSQASLNRQDIFDLPVFLPPLSEQRRIASVLGSGNTALEETENVIIKTEKLRDALLHELLTRGLPGHHTEWKEVPGLGTIPATWQATRLSEIAKVVTGNTPPRVNSAYYGGEVPWVKPSDLGKHYVGESAEYLTEEGLAVARLVPGGSVLVSCIGTIGEVAIAKLPLCFNQQINALIPNKKVLSSFLYWSVLNKATYIKAIAPMTAVPILNKNEFSKTKIAVPTIAEQRGILLLLDSINLALEQALTIKGLYSDLCQSMRLDLLSPIGKLK